MHQFINSRIHISYNKRLLSLIRRAGSNSNGNYFYIKRVTKKSIPISTNVQSVACRRHTSPHCSRCSLYCSRHSFETWWSKKCGDYSNRSVMSSVFQTFGTHPSGEWLCSATGAHEARQGSQ